MPKLSSPVPEEAKNCSFFLNFSYEIEESHHLCLMTTNDGEKWKTGSRHTCPSESIAASDQVVCRLAKLTATMATEAKAVQTVINWSATVDDSQANSLWPVRGRGMSSQIATITFPPKKICQWRGTLVHLLAFPVSPFIGVILFWSWLDQPSRWPCFRNAFSLNQELPFGPWDHCRDRWDLNWRWSPVPSHCHRHPTYVTQPQKFSSTPAGGKPSPPKNETRGPIFFILPWPTQAQIKNIIFSGFQKH